MGGICCCCKKSRVVVPRTKLQRREPPAMERFSKLAFSNNDPSKLIEGYEKEQLLSLEESLQPFQGRINHLSDQIAEAKSKCHFPSEHGLTRDESAAIYIYSMRNDSNSVYNRLHTAWESNNRAQMKPWFKYLRLFYNGLHKLPNAKGTVWQGVPYNEDLEKRLNSGSMPLYTSMGSCSPSDNVIQEHLKEKYGSKTILIGYDNVNAKDITDYTADGIEVLMLNPGLKLRKSQNMQVFNNGTMVFHLTSKSLPIPKDIHPPKSITPSLLSHRDSPLIRDIPLIKHFVCPMKKLCGNRCRGNHDLNHCNGFVPLYHSCSHHCGPLNNCNFCNKHIPYLRQCNKCNEHFCDDCCLQETSFI